MRLIFITGFGEEETIFDNLYPLLSGEKKFLSLWKELPDKKRPELHAALLASELIQQYNITPKDVVIGHSTGGWVALFIKQQVSCSIVQIASWTDPHKLILPPINRHLLFFLVRSGLYFNTITLNWALKSLYTGKPSAAIFQNVFTRLVRGNKENVVNQLRLILNPANGPVTVTPDLRVHSTTDSIVRFPDGPVHAVPGDHFSLYTYPSAVAEPIIQFLKKKQYS